MAVAGVVGLMGIYAVSAATMPAYACSTQAQPATSTPAPGASTQIGYIQDDMGNTHVAAGTKVTYAFCPPATGSHFTVGGPIAPRAYGPGDRVIPQGWIHNLEHGGLVILYRGREGDPGLTETAQAAHKAFRDTMPNSPVCNFPPDQQSAGVTIARFDEMETPYAALVWGRVFPLESFDQAAIMQMWNTYGERSNIEKFCETPAHTPEPSAGS